MNISSFITGAAALLVEEMMSEEHALDGAGGYRDFDHGADHMTEPPEPHETHHSHDGGGDG